MHLRLARFPEHTRIVSLAGRVPRLRGEAELHVDAEGRIVGVHWPDEGDAPEILRPRIEERALWLTDTAGEPSEAVVAAGVGGLADEVVVRLDPGGRLVGLSGPLVPAPAAARALAPEAEPAADVDEPGAELRPGDRLTLRRDSRDESRWRLLRDSRAIACLHLPPSGGPVLDLGDGEALTVDAPDGRTLALWDPGSGAAAAWFRRGRQPWRGRVILPGDDVDLAVRRRVLGGVRLDGVARYVVTREGGAQRVLVSLDDGGDLSPARAAAVQLVLTAVLLGELAWLPREHRAGSDLRWDDYRGFDFGGAADGGGGA